MRKRREEDVSNEGGVSAGGTASEGSPSAGGTAESGAFSGNAGSGFSSDIAGSGISSGGSSGADALFPRIGSGGIPGRALTGRENTPGEWGRTKDGRWIFRSPEGNIVPGWIVSNHFWYRTDEQGILQTGWVLLEGNWYFLHDAEDDFEGQMLGGWQCLNGKWYYLDLTEEGLGRMFSERRTPDGYLVGADGVWDGGPKEGAGAYAAGPAGEIGMNREMRQR